MAKTTDRRRDVVLLKALRADGSLAEDAEISVHDYYDGEHPLVDDDEYRARRGIVVLEGKVLDAGGKVDQDFRVQYSEAGAFVSSRVVHGDGTVIES